MTIFLLTAACIILACVFLKRITDKAGIPILRKKYNGKHIMKEM